MKKKEENEYFFKKRIVKNSRETILMLKLEQLHENWDNYNFFRTFFQQAGFSECFFVISYP